MSSQPSERRAQRHEISLPAELLLHGSLLPVTIGDLSGSGALLVLKRPPEEGTIASLHIRDFGELEVKVMFSGDGVCAVMFTHAAEHRDGLLKWLMQRIAEPRTKIE